MARLTEENFIAPQARDQAETEAAIAGTRLAQALEQRTMADKELALARAQLAQRTIASPLSGVVVERYASTGERIENRPLLKVAQIDPLRVEVVLPSSQFGQDQGRTVGPGPARTRRAARRRPPRSPSSTA